MRPTGRSYTQGDMIEVERPAQEWRYEESGEFIRATRDNDLVSIEVGFTGISEESSHAIDLPTPILAHLIDWLCRDRKVPR